ncbi:unnamed protein product, partial [Mesorhabditis spiculigera]
MMSAFQGFSLISYLCLFFFFVVIVEIQGKEYLCRQGVDYGLVDTWTREQGPKNSPFDGKQIHLISNTHKEVFAEYEKYIAKEVDITNPAARKKIDKKMPDWLPYALGGAAALLLLAAAVTTAVVLNAKKNKKKGKKEDEATSTEDAAPEKSQVSEATETTNEV